MDLSIVIPLAPNEKLNPRLIACLSQLEFSGSAEVILVSADEGTLSACMSGDGGEHEMYKAIERIETMLSQPLRYVVAPSGRASCMNVGAQESKGQVLWFLHADCYFSNQSMKAVNEKLKRVCAQLETNKIFYWELIFYGGGGLIKLNQWGVRFRSHFLKTPFGDQGLCMTKNLFETLGGYDVTAPYGEDHLLIRRARQSRVAIESLRIPIFTSARKYVQNGWLRTTVLHQRLWIQQIYHSLTK